MKELWYFIRKPFVWRALFLVSIFIFVLIKSHSISTAFGWTLISLIVLVLWHPYLDFIP